MRLSPDVVHKLAAFLDHANNTFELLKIRINSFFLQDRQEQTGQFGRRLLLQVMAVKPFGFLRIEPGPRFHHARKVEAFNQFVHREEFLLGSGAPAQKGQHVDESFRKIAILAVAAVRLAACRIFPQQRENRESHFIAVAFAQFAFSFRFQDQRKVRKARPVFGNTQRFV